MKVIVTFFLSNIFRACLQNLYELVRDIFFRRALYFLFFAVAK